MVISILIPVFEGVVDFLGCSSVAGLFKGLLPRNIFLFCPFQPGLCLIIGKISGNPPEPDKMTVFSAEGGLTVGGDGKICSPDGVSVVVKDLWNDGVVAITW